MPAEVTDGSSTSYGDVELLPSALAALQCPVAIIDAAADVVRAANAPWDGLAADLGVVVARKLTQLFPAAVELLKASQSGTRPLRHRAMPGAVPPGGAATWWDLEMVPHPKAAGCLIVTARDVSEQVLTARDAEATNAALSVTDVRLGIAEEATGIGLWDWNLETDVQAWSPAQFRLFGLDPARATPPRFADYIHLVHPDDRMDLVAAIGTGFSGGGGQRALEFRLRRADIDEERWILLLGRTVASNPDGRPKRLVGVSIDVTARRREHEALVASETRLRLAFQAAQMFAWDWDVKTGRVIWMDGLAGSVGLDDEGFGGTIEAFRALVHPDDAATVERALQEALTGRTPLYQAEFRMRRVDGSWRTTSTQGLVVRADDGTPLRVIGVDHDITERRAAEAALRDSERRLRLAMETAGLGAFEADIQAGRTLRDGTLSALLGLRRQETIADRENWLEFVHPEDRPVVEHALTEAATRGAPFQVEFRVERADGVTRMFASRGTLAGADRLLGVVQDVTEVREAEALLRESASRFEGMFDSMFEFVGLLSPDGALLKANRAALDFAGVSREQVVGRKFWETAWFTATPPAAEQVRRAVEQAATGKFVRYQVELRGAGRVAVIDFSIRPVRDAQGAVILLVPEGRDISELRAAEAKLAVSEARFRAIVDGLPLHAFTAQPNGDSDFISRSWFEYSGQTCDEALAFGWADRLHPDDREPTLAAWRAALAAGTPYQVEHRLRGADGAYRWFLTRAVVVGQEAPTAGSRWIGASVDVTAVVEGREASTRRADALSAQSEERRRNLEHAARELEAEIRLRVEMQTALAQARKLETMGQLTSSVAHDFNNVLAAIVGSYSLIRRRAAAKPVLEIVEHGDRAAERAKHLVRKLLAFARKDAPAPETLDLGPALRELLDLVGHAAGERVRCRLEIQPGVWTVLADVQELGVALINLAVNARDAMPEGGALTISARNLEPHEVPAQLHDGQYVSLAVHDEGRGMPPEILARAQEAFFTTKPRGEGTGLGLPMVQDFARRSGGTMRITSALWIGTTIEIVLPRAAAVASSPERLAALREISAPAFEAHGNATILLVEDDEQVRPLTAEFLRSLGYAVAAAPSAEAARVLLHSLPKLDLLITEVLLPGEDGIGLAGQLREDSPGLPVLFMTGNQPPPELEGEPVLLKPFRDTALARAVLDQLGREVTMDLGQAEPLLSRLTDPDMRALFVAWHYAKVAGEGYPHPSRIDPAAHRLHQHAFVATVERSEPPLFHYQSVGKALLDELARQSGGELVSPAAEGEALFGTLDGLYRRCLRTAAPVYQSADYEFGDGKPFHFERLILPASEDGETISHLIGIVLFGDRDPEQEG